MYNKSKGYVQEKINNGLQGLYVFQDGKMFPVVVFVYNEREQGLVERLVENTETIHYTTEDICNWCISHSVEYQIFVGRLDKIRPMKRFCYRKIIKRIKTP